MLACMYVYGIHETCGLRPATCDLWLLIYVLQGEMHVQKRVRKSGLASSSSSFFLCMNIVFFFFPTGLMALTHTPIHTHTHASTHLRARTRNTRMPMLTDLYTHATLLLPRPHFLSMNIGVLV